jgi:hypothetical protein
MGLMPRGHWLRHHLLAIRTSQNVVPFSGFPREISRETASCYSEIDIVLLSIVRCYGLSFEAFYNRLEAVAELWRMAIWSSGLHPFNHFWHKFSQQH